MDFFSNIALFSYFSIFSLFTSSTYAQTCSSYSFSNNNIYSTCNSLPVLNSFLHWNYHPSNHTVDIAYRQPGATTSNWIVWSLNPGGGQMIGAQCLVAFQNSAGQIQAYTSAITKYSTRMPRGTLSFGVPNIAAEYVNNQMVIYATIQLPSGSSSFRQVWQIGDVSGDVPQQHRTSGAYMRSYATVDFASNGTASGGSPGTVGASRESDNDDDRNEEDGGTSAEEGGNEDFNKRVHGVINVVSWGIMMPLGAIMARYLKVFKAANPAWFYLHVTCQATAYVVGVAGWVTGLKLGGDSGGGEQETHKNIGITLFALGTLQVFALLLRPKPDHKYRFYWNIYHHLTGYTVIILSIINIYEGLELLEPGEVWKRAYTGVLLILGASVVILEPYTWYVVLQRKRRSAASDKNSHEYGTTGINGSHVNGYGA